MKQFPSFLKFKKYHKVNFSFLILLERKCFLPIKGEYGLQSITAGKVTFRQIEACRRTIRRGLGKNNFIWVCVFPYVPISQKPVAARMGKGKGAVSFLIAPINQGQILF